MNNKQKKISDEMATAAFYYFIGIMVIMDIPCFSRYNVFESIVFFIISLIFIAFVIAKFITRNLIDVILYGLLTVLYIAGGILFTHAVYIIFGIFFIITAVYTALVGYVNGKIEKLVCAGLLLLAGIFQLINISVLCIISSILIIITAFVLICFEAKRLKAEQS